MAGMRLGRCVVGAVAFGVLGAGAAGPAAAGEYTVRTCNAAPTFATQAFGDFATRGMLVRRACDPEGRGTRGLIIGNVRRSGRVKPRSRSILALTAPKGAHFKRYAWSGQTARSDCGYSMYSYATGPGMSTISVATRRKKNRLAFKRCPRKGRFQASGNPRPTTHVVGNDATGADRIVHRVDCRASAGCAARGVNWVRIYKASVTVSDRTPPAVAITGGGLASGRWVSGQQVVQYAAFDNVGVRSGRVVAGSIGSEEVARACDYARTAPCPNGPATIGVNTHAFPEGTQAVAVRAIDSAGNSAQSRSAVARIDNTPPSRVDAVVDGGEGWRRTPDSLIRWANPSESDRAPIAAAHHSLCTKSRPKCSTGRTPGAGINRLRLTAPSPGEHTATIWREDLAGNRERDNESVAVTLRYDPEPPRPAFERGAASDPTRVSVAVVDKVSGLAGGNIEISQLGSGSWHGLETRKEANRLVARIDDARYAPGRYALRTRAFDQAGNEASTDRRADGSPMIITLPLRVAATMQAGVVRTRLVGRRGKRRRVTVLASKARVRFGRAVRIGGRLVNAEGDAIAGGRVLAYSRTRTSPEKLAGVTSTDSSGRYRYVARASSSRTLRFVYLGTGLVLPAQREVSLLVPAASSIRVNRRRLRNGQSVKFGGRLGQPVIGKLIELQVLLSGKFQTFKTVRTDARGRWATKYAFKRSCGRSRYRFRARLPREATYPFETGRTRAIHVTVRGLPCP